MLAWFTSAAGDAPGMADRLLVDLARDLQRMGARLGGAVQHNHDLGPDRPCDMEVEALGLDAPRFRISQSLGPGAQGCRLDPGALEQAAATALPGLADAQLVIVPKFARQEVAGRGFVALIADAMDRDLPVILYVPRQQADAFAEFAGELAQRIEPAQARPWALAQLVPPLDARDLLCPLPVLRLRKALEAADPGAMVRIRTTDRMALVDLPHFCHEAGHAMIAQRDLPGGVTEFTVARSVRHPAKAAP